jgi:ParB-like chromosome segregation protein Spo0J
VGDRAVDPGLSVVAGQPISAVEWVDRNELTANDYNPNVVARTELELLKLSIIEDGWTQPIVARADGEIVDGYHRWLCSEDPRVGGPTRNMVPVVRIREDLSPEAQRMATIRHNRARGVHHVLRVADVVVALVEAGVAEEDLEAMLGMEAEEVERMVERGNMARRGSREELSKAWRPAQYHEADPPHPDGRAARDEVPFDEDEPDERDEAELRTA